MTRHWEFWITLAPVELSKEGAGEMGPSRLEVLRDAQQLLLQLYPDLHHAVLPAPWGNSENKWCMENCLTVVCVKVTQVDLILVNPDWTWWDLSGKGLFHGTTRKVAMILSKVAAPANPQQPVQQSYCHTPVVWGWHHLWGRACSWECSFLVSEQPSRTLDGFLPRKLHMLHNLQLWGGPVWFSHSRNLHVPRVCRDNHAARFLCQQTSAPHHKMCQQSHKCWLLQLKINHFESTKPLQGKIVFISWNLSKLSLIKF